VENYAIHIRVGVTVWYVLLSAGHLVHRVTAVLRQRVHGLQQAAAFHPAIAHLLSAARCAILEDALHDPANCLFVCQVVFHALSFQKSLTAKSDAAAERADQALKNATEAILRCLQALHTQWEASVKSILCQRQNARTDRDTAAVNEDSEYPQSAEQSEPMEESQPQATPGTTEGRARRDTLVAHMDFVLMFRTLHCLASSCAAVTGPTGAVAPGSAALDSSLQKVITHSLRGHPAVVRAGQCLTVCMLDALFQHQQDPGTRPSPMAHPVTKEALSVLELAYSPRTPGSKIATIGVCSFIKYAALLSSAVRLLRYCVTTTAY
jgi:hypothetical protein